MVGGGTKKENFVLSQTFFGSFHRNKLQICTLKAFFFSHADIWTGDSLTGDSVTGGWLWDALLTC